MQIRTFSRHSLGEARRDTSQLSRTLVSPHSDNLADLCVTADIRNIPARSLVTGKLHSKDEVARTLSVGTIDNLFLSVIL